MPEEETEREDWPGLLICVPCEQYVEADIDEEETACEHSWDEACDVSEFTEKEWAKFRHDVYVKELERDEPRSRQMVLNNLTSLMWDLTSAGVLPDDYDERDGLDKLLVIST
jgi:hypothetical protein